MSIKRPLVVCDLDLTLLYASPIYSESSKAVYKALGKTEECLPIGTYHGGVMTWVIREEVRRILGNDLNEGEFEGIVKRVSCAWVTRFVELTRSMSPRVYDGVPEFLTELSKEADLGLVCGSLQTIVEALLEKSGLGGFFPSDRRVFAEGFRGYKRANALIDCIGLCGADRERIVYLGDNDRDVGAGLEAKKKYPQLVVATVSHSGRFSVETLKELGSEVALASFKECERPVERIIGRLRY